MAYYTIHNEYGEITSRINIPEIDKDLALKDVLYVEGEAPDNSYILNGEITLMPTMPLGVGWKFDVITGNWVQDTAICIDAGKSKRNSLLTSSDWTQGSDSPLTTELKTAWAVYRKKLRDMTEQDYLSNSFPSHP